MTTTDDVRPSGDAAARVLAEWRWLREGRDTLTSDWDDVEAAIDALAAEVIELRVQLSDLIGILQGAASLWSDMYPAWLVYALLGDDATAAVPLSRIHTGNMESYQRVRAIVATHEARLSRGEGTG